VSRSTPSCFRLSASDTTRVFVVPGLLAFWKYWMLLLRALPGFPRAFRPSLPPRHGLRRSLAANVFRTLNKDERLEEETLWSDRASRYYPARLGELLDARYQLLCKLGYGVYSTVWLCRDLRSVPSSCDHLDRWSLKCLVRQHAYVAIKIFVSSTSYETQAQREIQVSQHVSQVKSQHLGYPLVRTIRDQFVVTGPTGQHHCLVHTPLSIKLSVLHRLMPNERFPSNVTRSFAWHILKALDFLHSEARVIHCGTLLSLSAMDFV
jgi:hypothetical protein